MPNGPKGPKGHNYIGLVVSGSPNGVWQGAIHRVITVEQYCMQTWAILYEFVYVSIKATVPFGLVICPLWSGVTPYFPLNTT